MSQLILHWNTLDLQSKQEILSNACLQSRLAYYNWEELEEWICNIIRYNLEKWSKYTTTIEA